MAFSADATTSSQPSSQRKILSQRAKKPDELDMLLESQGLYRKRMPRDGNSLFRSISDQLLGSQKYYPEVRTAILSYFMENPTEVEQILSRTNFPGLPLVEYLIERCLTVLRAVYKINLKVYKEPGADKINCCYLSDFISSSSPQVTLSVDSELHWDSVYSHEHMQNLAFCQGTIYNMLYEDVFKLKNIQYAVHKMLDKTSKTSLQSLRNPRGQEAVLRIVNGDFSMFDAEVDMKSLVDQGIPPFPFKVAKSLDLNIYRNVEFDNWETIKGGPHHSRRELVLQIGSKCMVHTRDNATFVGYVQQLDEENDMASVYVEQVGKIKDYPISMLLPCPLLPARKKYYNSRRCNPMLKDHSLRSSAKPSVKVELYTDTNSGVEQDEAPQQEEVLTVAEDGVSEVAVADDAEQHQEAEYEDSYSADESNVESDEPQPVHPDIQQQPPQPFLMQEPMQHPYYTEPLYYAPAGYYPAYFPYTYSPVDMSVTLSYSVDGSDLPMNDMQTLRYFFNQGVQYVRSLRNNLSNAVPPNFHVTPNSMENPTVIGPGVIPVQATVVPPGTPITPVTPPDTLYMPVNQQNVNEAPPVFLHEVETMDGGHIYIPQYYVTTPATPPACHTAYVPQWNIYSP